jgi:hypothetical protein
MSTEIVAGLIGAAATALLAILNSYLTSRAQVAEEIRKARLTSYAELWRLTSLVSVWPRSDPTVEDLEGLHRALRKWYFEVGGLYLSENARARYGEVQKLLARVVANFQSLHKTAAGRLSENTYKDLQNTCSALRTALTEDLETRAQRSVLRSLGLVWQHRKQWFQARKRIRRAGKLADDPDRYELEEWQRLGIPQPRSAVGEPNGKKRSAVPKKRTRWFRA